MSGIVFLRTRELDRVRDFYISRIGMREWLIQGDVVILSHGSMRIGFHAAASADADALITFVYPTREEVDRMYARVRETAADPPRLNETYRIHHFFAVDPEGRRIEFASFEDPVDPMMDGEELLGTRRSVRRFRSLGVDARILASILESCRMAPSARNAQPVEFVLVRDPEKLKRLAALRDDSSDPIGRAPMAVAIVSDPAISPRAGEDGCIAAYHFLLAAWLHGLGTCWIGGMDRDDAKRILEIPSERIVTTITPLGWPAETPEPKPRREVRSRVI